MTSIAIRADQAPLSEEQIRQLNTVLPHLSPEQSIWLSGYLAGAAGVQPGATVQTQADPQQVVTILYGSQTGNARRLAEAMGQELQQSGWQVNLSSTGDFPFIRLKKTQYLLILVSTHGEGDPPDDAIDFYDSLMDETAPKLSGLKYSVLALGDSSYADFCQTGIEVDQRLEALGAERLATRVDCDVDFSTAAAGWQQAVCEQLEGLNHAASASPNLNVVSFPSQTSAWSREQPFSAALLKRHLLVSDALYQDHSGVAPTWHVELSLEDSGLQYAPGDSLGVWVDNDADLVAKILAQTQLTGDEQVKLDDQELSLQQALQQDRELTLLHVGFLQQYSDYCAATELQALLQRPQDLQRYIKQHQLLDVLHQFPALLDAQGLVDLLRPLTPRLYSIASAQSAVDESVHLTVAIKQHQTDDQRRFGLASYALAERDLEQARLRVYVEPAKHFHLPDSDTPVIMIGAGTGIAPYRAFLQQREMEQASGKNWLLFGNRRFKQDFLYQSEWLRWRRLGLLNRFNGAFSRDQEHKVYVQHLVGEQGAEIFDWLEQGAHLYICGSIAMGQGVEQALRQAYQDIAGCDEDAAGQQLKTLRKDKRLHKDVY